MGSSGLMKLGSRNIVASIISKNCPVIENLISNNLSTWEIQIKNIKKTIKLNKYLK